MTITCCLATVIVNDKINYDERMHLVRRRFDGHRGAPEQYRRHRSMRHVQGYSGSHWTPASGDYLLHIAPASARATINKTTIKQYTHFAGHLAMQRYNTTRIARWRGSRASLEATGCHHWASTCSNSHQSDMPTPVFSDVFHCQIVKKGHKAQE